MKVEVGKKYTSAGFPGRVLATDLKGEYPVAVAVEYGHGEEVQAFTADGKWIQNHSSAKDLKPVPQTFTLTRWVNVYREKDGTVYSSGYDYATKDTAYRSRLSNGEHVGTFSYTLTGEIPEE